MLHFPTIKCIWCVITNTALLCECGFETTSSSTSLSQCLIVSLLHVRYHIECSSWVQGNKTCAFKFFCLFFSSSGSHFLTGYLIVLNLVILVTMKRWQRLAFLYSCGLRILRNEGQNQNLSTLLDYGHSSSYLCRLDFDNMHFMQ